MFTKEDYNRLSIDVVVNLINQLEEERNMYRDKWQKFARKQSENRVSIGKVTNLHNIVYSTRQEAIDTIKKLEYNSIL